MNFYSYLWLREDGSPYYVGKGKGNRAFRGRRNGGHLPHPIKDRVVIFPMLNEAEAFESEMALIELFGRKDNGTGILRNLTDGGEGTAGFCEPKTTTHRERIKVALTGKPKSLEHRTALRLANLGKASQFKGMKHSEESRKAMSIGHMGHLPWNKGLTTGPLPIETRLKMSISHSGKPSGAKGTKRSEDVLLKMKETGIKAMHTRWHTKRGGVNPNCKHCGVSRAA
jgi:hypothetical protein